MRSLILNLSTTRMLILKMHWTKLPKLRRREFKCIAPILYILILFLKIVPIFIMYFFPGLGLKPNVTLLLFPYEEEGRRGRLGKPFFSQEGHKVAEGNGLNNHVVSGWGIRFSNTSTAFVGQFVKNQLSGQGIQFVDQQIVYEGQFKEDIRSGTHTRQCPKKAGIKKIITLQ